MGEFWFLRHAIVFCHAVDRGCQSLFARNLWQETEKAHFRRVKSTLWFSFSAKIKFRTHSCQKSKKNKIEQCTKIFIYRDLNGLTWRQSQTRRTNRRCFGGYAHREIRQNQIKSVIICSTASLPRHEKTENKIYFRRLRHGRLSHVRLVTNRRGSRYRPHIWLSHQVKAFFVVNCLRYTHLWMLSVYLPKHGKPGTIKYRKRKGNRITF